MLPNVYFRAPATSCSALHVGDRVSQPNSVTCDVFVFIRLFKLPALNVLKYRTGDVKAVELKGN
jgi:hypothetical protein